MRRLPIAAALALAITACSGGGPSGNVTPSTGSLKDTTSSLSALRRAEGSTGGGAAPVYVGVGQNRLDVYADRGSSTSFPAEGAPIKPAFKLALTSLGDDGDMYVSADYPSPQEIVEYGPWGHNVLRTITAFAGHTGSFAASKNGTLYVAEALRHAAYQKIYVYPRGATAAVRDFDAGPASQSLVLFVSPLGDLYAASIDQNSNTITMRVFKPDTKSPAYSFTFAAVLPTVQFDNSGNFYAETADANFNNRGVLVYPPGATTPSYEITNGMSNETNIVVNRSSGELFALNSDNTINVYAPGATSPAYTIPGLTSGFAENMAVDPWNNLYVFYAGTTPSYIAVYPPGASAPSIQQNVFNAWGVYIGPISH